MQTFYYFAGRSYHLHTKKKGHLIHGWNNISKTENGNVDSNTEVINIKESVNTIPT